MKKIKALTLTLTLVALVSLPRIMGTGYAETNTSTIEFIGKEAFKEKNAEQSLTPNTFYYFNAKNDPTIEPVVGTDKENKYIQISGISGQDVLNLNDSTANLVRYIPIPKNPPSEIIITCNTKLETKKLSGWELGGVPQGGVTLRFIKPGVQGPAIPLPVNPDTDWETQTKRIPIPEGAEYLVVDMHTRKNEKLSLANWTIQ